MVVSQWQFLTLLHNYPSVDSYCTNDLIDLKIGSNFNHTLINDLTFFILLINMRHVIYFKKSWQYQNFPKNLNLKLSKNHSSNINDLNHMLDHRVDFEEQTCKIWRKWTSGSETTARLVNDIIQNWLKLFKKCKQ